MFGATDPNQPQIGHVLLHEVVPTLVSVGRLALHVWWFFVLAGALAVVRIRLAQSRPKR
jgi:hypothetical protein